MNEIELLSTRLQQTFVKAEKHGTTIFEGSFHGPSLLESIEGVRFKEASIRVIEGRHTLWEIVNHCSFWMKEFTKALQGYSMSNINQFEDWPEQGTTEKDWIRDTGELVESYDKLLNEIQKLDELDLEKIAESIFHEDLFKFTLRKMIYGVIDHNLYHTGQISQLRST